MGEFSVYSCLICWLSYDFWGYRNVNFALVSKEIRSFFFFKMVSTLVMLWLVLVNTNIQNVARRKELRFCVHSLSNMADPLTTES